MQWHPLLTELLTSCVGQYYELHDNKPVGQLPRESDLVLARRPGTAPALRSLWQHLTPFAVVEIKGPSERARLAHMPLLAELGLGIHRQFVRGKQPRARAEVTSCWYLVRTFGRRFIRLVGDWAGRALVAVSPGVWRGRVLGHPLFVVSCRDVPLEAETFPLHLVYAREESEQSALLRFVEEHTALWQHYAPTMLTLHPRLGKELDEVARRKQAKYDIRPAVEMVGLGNVIEQVGLGKVIEKAGLGNVIEEAGLGNVIEEAGLGNVIEEAGLARILREARPEQVAEGLPTLVEMLTPEQRRQLREALDQ